MSYTTGLEFYPLSIGNYWKYARVPHLIANRDSTFIESVSHDTTLNGEKWSFLSHLSGAQIVGSYFSNRRDGIWVLSLYPNTETRIVYKYPVTINESYIGNYSTDTIHVVGLHDRVEVPAGTFSCVTYQRKFLILGSDSTFHTYYRNIYVAPGIGRVKEELFTYNQSSQAKESSQFILLEYSLNQRIK